MKIVQFQDGSYGIRKFACVLRDEFIFNYVFLCNKLYYEDKSYNVNLWFRKQDDDTRYKMDKETVVERWNQRKLTIKKIQKLKLKKIDVGKPCKQDDFRDERIGFSFKMLLRSMIGEK